MLLRREYAATALSMTASALWGRATVGTAARATATAAAEAEARHVIFLIVLAYPAELMPFLF
jgi:hypothetical protein